MRYDFIVGRQYRRRDVFRVIGVPEDTKGGNWDTGYNRHGDDWFIFCNIGKPGRTGHDYNNEFVGADLVWYGKTQSKLHHPTIQSMLKLGGRVYVFARENNQEPFTYVGAGRAKAFYDSTPVKIVWEFVDEEELRPETLPEEVSAPQKYFEGATRQVSVNVYERNPLARRKCIEHYGSTCSACDFDFGERYGDIGKGFIHVHHLKALADIGTEYELDPVRDLRPVCPNCHAMLHRKKPPYTIEELKSLITTPPTP